MHSARGTKYLWLRKFNIGNSIKEASLYSCLCDGWINIAFGCGCYRAIRNKGRSQARFAARSGIYFNHDSIIQFRGLRWKDFLFFLEFLFSLQFIKRRNNFVWELKLILTATLIGKHINFYFWNNILCSANNWDCIYYMSCFDQKINSQEIHKLLHCEVINLNVQYLSMLNNLFTSH